MADDSSPAPPRDPCEVHDDTMVVFLAGEFDAMSQGQLEIAVSNVPDRQRATTIIVDLGGLEFMDSTGLRDLICLRSSVASEGVEVSVRGARPHVRRLFEITALTHFLDD